MRVLVLGGTTEATRLARLLAARPDIDATMSLAGRTAEPAPQPIPTRVGGFGGVDGLAVFLADTRTDAIVDATHPFAARMGFNAAQAAERLGLPIVALSRPAWTAGPGDRWTEVADLAAAAEAIGETPRRVLLTVGRLGLPAFQAAPQHAYLIRTIDPPEGLALPDARIILDRPPFDADAEAALMRAERIDVLVTKNSGGSATAGKLAAACSLGLPVILVRRPPRPDVATVHEPEAVLAFLDAHRPSPALRGV